MAREEGDINIARIPVSGIGGLGMVAAAVMLAVTLPPLRWIAVASLVGGIAVGLTLIGARNRGARHAAEVGAAASIKVDKLNATDNCFHNERTTP